MEYRLHNRDDCDISFKVGAVRVLAYSKSGMAAKSPDAQILGEVILSRKDVEVKGDHVVTLGKRKFVVRDAGETNRFFYKTKGFVAVGENEYIRILESRLPFLLALALLILAAGVAVTIILLLPGKAVAPPTKLENPLPMIDPYALNDTSARAIVDTPAHVPEGGGSVSISFKPTATLDLATGEIKMGFTNPATSSHAAVLELFVVYTDANGNKGELQIATSGLILSGKKLGTMKLDPDKAGVFNGEGKYNAKYRLQYYDPNTGIQSVVDAELNDVVLYVKK